MYRILFVLSVIFLLLFAADGQGSNRRVARGDLAFSLHQYSEAVAHYRRAYSRVRREDRNEAARISFNSGIAFFRMNNFRQAEIHLKRAIRLRYPNPEVYLYLADALMANRKAEEALTNFRRFSELAPDDWRGRLRIVAIDTARYLNENPTAFLVAPAARLNSRFDDLTSAWGDHMASVLIFASNRDEAYGESTDPWFGRKHSSLFVSYLDRTGVWSAPDLLDEGPLNTEANEGAPGSNARGNELFFTRCVRTTDVAKGCRIWVSRRQGAAWGEPVVLPLVQDSSITLGHPALSLDELTLYFVSDLPGGMGGMDIWFVRRRSRNDNFGAPQNLGPPVNTPGNESFPFVRDNGALYFSSDGHPGLGALDVFVANWSPTGWSHPQNLGVPINSQWDDFGVLFFPGRNQGFLTSNRHGSRGYDIHSFVLHPLEFTLTGRVQDQSNNENLAGVTIQLLGTDGTFSQTVTNTLGQYWFQTGLMQPNTQFEVIASKSQYFTSRGNLTTAEHTVSHNFTLNFLLAAIPPEPIMLPEILFDFGRWELKPQYQDSLNGLVKTLNDNPGLVIELASHTDSRGAVEANDTLSQRRAQSVVEYLILMGIDRARMVAKGYGETKPRTLHRNIERDGVLFRQGQTLSDEFINALPTERQREAAHALNRRTEFRILRDDFRTPNLPANPQSPGRNNTVQPGEQAPRRQ